MARCSGHIHHHGQDVLCNKETHPATENCAGWLHVNWPNEQNEHQHEHRPEQVLLQDGLEIPIPDEVEFGK